MLGVSTCVVILPQDLLWYPWHSLQTFLLLSVASPPDLSSLVCGIPSRPFFLSVASPPELSSLVCGIPPGLSSCLWHSLQTLSSTCSLSVASPPDPFFYMFLVCGISSRPFLLHVPCLWHPLQPPFFLSVASPPGLSSCLWHPLQTFLLLSVAFPPDPFFYMFLVCGISSRPFLLHVPCLWHLLQTLSSTCSLSVASPTASHPFVLPLSYVQNCDYIL